MKLPLSNGGHAIVDSGWQSLRQYRWYYSPWGVRTSGGLSLHRVIAGARKGEQVKFIDGDKRNCRANNLIKTKLKPRQGNGGYVGVSKHGDKYQARLQGKYLGVFDTAKEAARVRDKAAKQVYGRLAILNLRKDQQCQ